MVLKEERGEMVSGAVVVLAEKVLEVLDMMRGLGVVVGWLLGWLLGLKI